MKKFGWILSFALILASTPAFASGGDVTLYGGLQRQGKLTLQNATSNITSTAPNLLTTNPANFGTFGLRLGIGKKVAGAETTFAYSPNFISTSAKALIMNQNLMLQVPTPILKPYVTAGLGTVITVGALMVFAEGLEWVLAGRFARKYGGSKRAGWGAVIGGMVGAFLGVPIPIVGSIIGAFVGAFIGAFVFEWTGGAETKAAGRVAWGAFLGRVIAAFMKVGIGLAMAVWVVFALWLH